MDDSKNFKKNKVINQKDLVMDINQIENPLFIYERCSKEVQENVRKVIMEEIDGIEEEMVDLKDYKKMRTIHKLEPKLIEKKVIQWVDSKNTKRELRMSCDIRLPREFEFNLFYGLTGLYIQNKGPFIFDEEAGKYDMHDVSLSYSFKSLCKYMDIKPTGQNIKNIKLGIKILARTHYESLASGILYDKVNEKYVVSKEEGFTLIEAYSFVKRVKNSNGKLRFEDSNMVRFNPIIINNIAHEYFRYICRNTFFSLPSGLTRKLYVYLEKNKYSNNKPVSYIKRSFELLRTRIPIEYEYTSGLKRKINTAAKYLIEKGIIKDVVFGDEVLINGKKEDYVYFLFEDTKENFLKKINTPELPSKDIVLEDKPYLTLPEDIYSALIDIGTNKKIAEDFIREHDKWKLLTYYILIKKKIYIDKDSMGNPPGFLTFALKYDYILPKEDKEITDFIEKEKAKEVENAVNLEDEYKKYIDSEIEKFKNEEPQMYNIFYNQCLISMDETVDKVIQQLTLAKQDCSKQLEYKANRENSDYFKEAFKREVALYRNLMDFNHFLNIYKTTK